MRVLTDIDALKALAHPLRQQMLTRLQQRGPATAAILAEEFTADRGATSYHLRQLHRFGFIEEDTARSAGRRRFWRAVPQDLRLPPHGPDPEINLVADEIQRQWYERGQTALRYAATHRDEFGAFGEAMTGSHGGTFLTAEELTRFAEEYISLLQRWHRGPDAAAPGARHVTALFYAFPTPTQPTPTHLTPQPSQPTTPPTLTHLAPTPTPTPTQPEMGTGTKPS